MLHSHTTFLLDLKFTSSSSTPFEVQPRVWAVQPEQLLELQRLFSSAARMRVIRLPNPSRIPWFAFYIIFTLLQQATAERELKFVAVVSRFIFCLVVGNMGNSIWLSNQRRSAVALSLFDLETRLPFGLQLVKAS